ncbi:hypothetical protein MZD04_gp318 [Pseudomonas phage Psa21]|uniref:Lipoprotein n=1 Tax=Pseudomonas phage Psa21 TaxID=2530023 RepID=A0A481W642_9CAUD|nr:hypothetical protein MZD04_gp318 [Pseudomonas phage Psa21]QBJ02844.1 hypothetical protein PSA21_318 [Pseudomonas phage Psa21]
MKYIVALLCALLITACKPQSEYTTKGLLIGASCGKETMGRFGVTYDSGCVAAVKDEKGVATFSIESDSGALVGSQVVIIKTGDYMYRVIKSIE